MKLKKLLALILCVAMVLSTMSFTALAADEAGSLSAYLDSYRVWGSIDNASADESVEVKVYSEETLIATSTLTDKSHIDGNIETLTWQAKTNGDTSSSWNMVWEAGHPIDNAAPTKAELWIDDVLVDTADVGYAGPDDLYVPFVWAEVEGVAPSPKGTLVGTLMNVANPDRTFIAVDLNNVYAKESLEVKFYDEAEECIGTMAATNLALALLPIKGTMNGMMCLTGSDDYWNATWEGRNPIENRAPKTATLFIDGEEKNTVELNYATTSGEAAIEWKDMNGVNPAPKGTLVYSRVNNTDSKGTYITTGLNNVYAYESIELRIYDKDNNLLATTKAEDKLLNNLYQELNAVTKITRDSSSWSTTWEEGKLREDYIPARIEIYVDGSKTSECDVEMKGAVSNAPIVWGEVDGVNPAPKGTLQEGRINVKEANRTFITIDASNVYAEDSIVLKIYDENDTLLATTEATDKVFEDVSFPADSFSTFTGINCTDPYWTTTWEDEKLRADYVPAKAVLTIDGKEVSTGTIGMKSAWTNDPIVWAEVNGVPATPAGAINVILEATDAKNVYNIKLQSADEHDIYEFVAAEFTFKNESTTVGGGEMAYEILGYTENGVVKTVAEQAAKDEYENEQYIIRIPAGEEVNRLSGHEFVIGQVKFIGQATTQFQGNIKFSIKDGEVDTTKEGTHLGKYYTVDNENAKLNLGEDATIDSTVSEIKRDVAVNVAFNHYIDTEDYWNGYQITATIKNNFGYEEEQEIVISDINAGATTFVDVPLGQITVTLKAPGFRTYTYKTVVEETADNGVLVLNFWNDIKRETADYKAIEAGKTPTNKNFVVGDIVMDMNVDIYDLAAVTSYYGTYSIDTTANADYIRYDLNRDGDIDIRDVQYVLHTMGN